MRSVNGNQFETEPSGSAPTEQRDDDRAPVVCDASPARRLASRREVMREGAKLAFVAPLLSTFLASQAYAANYSCYPAGGPCDGGEGEPCCSGTCVGNVCQ